MISVNNPWNTNRITWGDPFADGDKEVFAKMGYMLCTGKEKKFDKLMNCEDLESRVSKEKLDKIYWDCCLEKYKKSAGGVGLDFYTLPEPYTGDINSPVYCLNMNPGEADGLFINDPIYWVLTLLTLDHTLPYSFWINAPFNKYKLYDCKTGMNRVHNGCNWQVQKLKDLYDNGKPPKLFILEYFPYHSKDGFKFPSWLPSYAYTNELIEKAMDKGKFIVIMRQRERWFKRIPRLEHYTPLAFLSNPQNATLSNGSVVYRMNAFNDLVAALKTENNH